MTGLVVCLDPVRSSAAMRELGLPALKSLRHRGKLHDDYNADGLFMGIIHNGHDHPEGRGTTLHHPDLGVSVVAAGYIENRDDLVAGLNLASTAPGAVRDTEILAAAYRRWGADLASRILGAVAFAIHDHRKRTTVIVRDRYGQRDLFWARLPEGGIALATEAKALFRISGIVPRPDYLGLHDYFSFRFAVPPRTCFEGISRILPATVSVIDMDGTIETAPYWRRASIDPAKQGMLRDEAAEQVVEIFDRAIARSRVSAGRVGAFLSGGVDSGAVVARLVPQQAHAPTFCASFNYDDFDESELAQMHADHFGSDHTSIRFDERIFSHIESMAYHFGEPIGDSSFVITYGLCRQIGTGVDCMLGGDGAERIFIGNQRYVDMYNYMKAVATGGYLPTIKSQLVNQGLGSLLPRDYFTQSSSVFTERHKIEGYGDALGEYLYSPANDRLPVEFEGPRYDHAMDACGEVDAHHLMGCNFLVKFDTAAGAHGFETRMPMLDPEFSDFVTSLPHELRVFERHGELQLKGLLRYCMEPYMLHDVLYGANHGFSIPLRHWIGRELREVIDDILLSGGFAARGLFTADYIARIISEHRAGRSNHSQKIWSMIAVEMWFRVYIDGSGANAA
ncbi:asparagine synthetase B family protein [Palleronia sp.]|uniref:asparagine synthetase B family protein n=1 Tax=Palleronia sp. TaxID=1940284 RepID=UPI0035C7ECE6